jgi:putative aminopeptidase FrvX
MLPTPLTLLAEFVALPGPPGQESLIRDAVAAHVTALGLPHTTDARGNLLVGLGDTIPAHPRIIVTAHLDEIAAMVTHLSGEDSISVSPLGGLYPWKWGEGPVEIFASGGIIPGVLCFGSIHTTSPHAAISHARDGRSLGWGDAYIRTGLSPEDLQRKGVRPGTRVVMARSRRTLFPLANGLVGSYFLDDRGDLVAWLLALETLKNTKRDDILFAATTSEEMGGHGANWLLGNTRPEVCIALEIGPTTPDMPFPIDDNPTAWVADSYAQTAPADLDLLVQVVRTKPYSLHFHAVTRGGSDATCAAANGLCARPFTLSFPADNSHGFEIMHENALTNLADLTLALIEAL